MLGRFCKTSAGTAGNDSERQAWTLAFRSLIATDVNDDKTWATYIDKAIQVKYGLPLSGFHPVLIEVCGSVINVLPMLASAELHLASCQLLTTSSDSSDVELFHIISCLAGAGMELMWSWMQVVIFIDMSTDAAT